MNREGRQGIELEGYVQDIKYLKNLDTRTSFKHSYAVSEFRKIHPNFLIDDGKPEFFSEPKRTLGELEDHVRNIIVQCIEIASKQNWIYSLTGCSPFFSSFAGGHVHTSISSVPKIREIKEIRRKLYSVQPLIALLSQNSPIMNGRESLVKDSRLAYSTWSSFTALDTDSKSHYLALAKGRKAHTLECRIPASSSLYQILGVIAFIKTVVNIKDSLILPFSFCQDNFYKVIKWGGQALIPLIDPSKITYLGLDGKQVYVPVSSLFRLFLENNESSEVLKEVLQEVSSSTRTKILEFYNIIASGLTVSDYLLREFRENSDRVKFSRKIADITFYSYVNKNPFWTLLSKPDILLPKIEKTLSLKELTELLKNTKDYTSELNIGEIAKYNNIIYENKLSIVRDPRTKRIILDLLKEIPFLKLDKYYPEIRFLNKHKIIKAKPSEKIPGFYIERGELFPYIVQLCSNDNVI